MYATISRAAGSDSRAGNDSHHSLLRRASSCSRSTAGRRRRSYSANALARSGASRSASTSPIASSMASFVPEPMEKWAVWAASPRSTVRPSDQRSQVTVRNRSHRVRLPINGWPRSCAANAVSR
jgi:hypothetical protein